MLNIQTITNVSDCVPLYLPHSLYLKPLAKIHLSVSIPAYKMGKSISNLDVMEKLTNALKPDKFLVLKVLKTTVDFIKFEAELEERAKLQSALSRLDAISLKINGFNSSFKVRASECKDEFPSRHDWDLFFRDATNMDEMKAGERPDTIHLSNLPIRWFCPRHMENSDNVKPSESIFKRIFEKFGNVRSVDIPICDLYRPKMNSDISGMKTFSYEQDVLFEGYVQFEEYVGFVRAMDEFRGMKLVRKFIDKTQCVNIFVTFDTTKHLSEATIQRRDRVRKRLISKSNSERDKEQRSIKAEKEKLENERKLQEESKAEELERQREREEKRKEKQLKKLQERGELEISQKILLEEKKLVVAQRKLESIRILGELFSRIKMKETKISKRKEVEKQKNDKRVAVLDLRDKLVDKYKSATEKLLVKQKQKLEEIKSKTPFIRLLHKNCSTNRSSDISNESDSNENGNGVMTRGLVEISSDAEAEKGSSSVNANMNPFKMSIFPYVPQVFPNMLMFRHNFAPQVFSGMPMFRPNYNHQMNYRGYAPRNRGRGRGDHDGYSNKYSYQYNKNYKTDIDPRYIQHSRSRSKYRWRSRTKSSSRERSRSRSRCRSRSRSRSCRRHNEKHSRSRSRSRKRRIRSRSRFESPPESRSSRTHSRSRISSSQSHRHTQSRSKSFRSKSLRISKELVSTRRSLSLGDRSKSRAKEGWPKKSDRRKDNEVKSKTTWHGQRDSKYVSRSRSIKYLKSRSKKNRENSDSCSSSYSSKQRHELTTRRSKSQYRRTSLQSTDNNSRSQSPARRFVSKKSRPRRKLEEEDSLSQGESNAVVIPAAKNHCCGENSSSESVKQTRASRSAEIKENEKNENNDSR